MQIHDEHRRATTLPGPWSSIDEIIEANKDIDHHFFDEDACRFFDSKIGQTIWMGRFFITSEQFHGSDNYHGPRRFTIRIAHDDGKMGSIGYGVPRGFGEGTHGHGRFPTYDEAVQYITRLYARLRR